MARIPQDSTYDVQRSIQDINDEFDRVNARLSSLDPSIINADIDALSAALEKVRADIIKTKTLDFNDVFRPAGPAHAIGYVPTPGPTAGGLKFLRDDATWANLTADAVDYVVVEKDFDYEALSSDNVILCDASGGAFTITLPEASATGKLLHVKKIDSSTEVVTILGHAIGLGRDLVEDNVRQYLTLPGESLMLMSDGTQWWVL